MEKTRKKVGGRQKGTPNKKTLILEDLLNEKEIEPIAGLKSCLDELNELVVFEDGDKINLIKAKADIFMELLSYLYPKRKSIEFKPDEGNPNSVQIVTIKWADEDGTDVNIPIEDETQDAASDSNQSEPKTI